MNSPLRDAWRHPALPAHRARLGATRPVRTAPPRPQRRLPRPIHRHTGAVEHPGATEGRPSWAGVLLFACLGASLFLLYLV